MKIENIELTNFRNIEKMKADFDSTNIIWGENAQGKTNLLEALYLFSGEKSFRGAKDRELIKFGCEFCTANINFEASNRKQNAKIVIKNKRSITLNGIKKTTGDLCEEIKAVIFSPEHLDMIKGSPVERRFFADTALCQINKNYRKLLSEYNKILRQRNSLLKNLDLESDIKKTDNECLDIWDKSLATAGAKIVFQRRKYIEAILPFAKNVFEGISSKKEVIGLDYSSHIEYENNMSIGDMQQIIYENIKNHKLKDIINKTTTVGPHRDDIMITINSKAARNYASQGQQRSCVLALKLAEADLLYKKTQKKPIVLLDDVMSELDENRQNYILNSIRDRQIFVTCCDKNTILRLKKGKTFHISSGKLE